MTRKKQISSCISKDEDQLLTRLKEQKIIKSKSSGLREGLQYLLKKNASYLNEKEQKSIMDFVVNDDG